MANPAELLYGILTKWDSQVSVSSGSAQTRGDDAALTEHRRAVQLVDQIDEILGQMERSGKRVEVYRRTLPKWVNYIFCFPSNWNAANQHIDANALDVLDLLRDAMADFVPALDESRFEELKLYLELVDSELREDDSLPLVVRESTKAVIENLRTLIDHYTVAGDYELDVALRTLLGSLALVAMRSQHTNRWQKLINQIVLPYATNQLPALDGSQVSAMLSLPGT